VLSILRAVLICAKRESASLSSIQGNNVFYWLALLSLQPESALLWWIVLGLILLLPALLSPFAKIPEARLALWPISDRAKTFLRPFTQPLRRSAPWLWHASTLELRQLLRTLDFYFALLFSLAATAYRLAWPKPEAEAIDAMSMLVVLALSTLAQNLFTLDGPARRRWKLSPARGATLLFRKGRILLALTTFLCLPLSPLAAFTAMLAALAIGHHNSVLAPQDSVAWRFSAGRFFPHGLLQVVASFACGIAVARGEYLFLAGAAAAYALSLLIYGWLWDHT
jgi:hypothetical protein